MRISDDGVALVKEFEGCELKAYRCPAGVLTVGYGSTGTHVHEGQEIDEITADAYLRKDLEVAEKCIAACVNVALTQGQFDALCSFVFNLGCGAFRKSTLLRKLNDGDDVGAADEFQRWSKAGGKELPGLVRRRKAEKELFLS
jgi:lysozyme